MKQKNWLYKLVVDCYGLLMEDTDIKKAQWPIKDRYNTIAIIQVIKVSNLMKLNVQLLCFMCLFSDRLKHIKGSTHDVTLILGS